MRINNLASCGRVYASVPLWMTCARCLRWAATSVCVSRDHVMGAGRRWSPRAGRSSLRMSRSVRVLIGLRAPLPGRVTRWRRGMDGATLWRVSLRLAPERGPSVSVRWRRPAADATDATRVASAEGPPAHA